jgi:hypothetical protein
MRGEVFKSAIVFGCIADLLIDWAALFKEEMGPDRARAYAGAAGDSLHRILEFSKIRSQFRLISSQDSCTIRLNQARFKDLNR